MFFLFISTLHLVLTVLLITVFHTNCGIKWADANAILEVLGLQNIILERRYDGVGSLKSGMYNFSYKCSIALIPYIML